MPKQTKRAAQQPAPAPAPTAGKSARAAVCMLCGGPLVGSGYVRRCKDVEGCGMVYPGC